MRVSELLELTTVPTMSIKKHHHLDVLPNDGKPIPPGRESEFLGKHIGDLNRQQVWRHRQGLTSTYLVYNPQTRISQLGCSGTRYKNNPSSLVIMGLFSGPKNTVRAADLYNFLVQQLGLTLVSDNKQSAGGYSVWKELERRYGQSINIHGFDTKTNQGVNVTTKDEPDTHVSRDELANTEPGMKRERNAVAQNLRFVASPK